jgi:predicted nucleic acid-binding protein
LSAPRFILDNSVSAAWCFNDESNDYTEAVFQSVAKDGGAVAPALWPIELANALVVAERKRRITTQQREAFLKHLAGLEIEIQPLTTDQVFHKGIALATTHRLSVYDATYLGIALEQRLPLATQDGELIRAANEVGVALFQP